MKAALAFVLAKLLTVSAVNGAPVYAPHIRHHELGAAAALDELAAFEVEAAQDAGVAVHDFAALVHHESGGNRWAVSKRGAFGLSQLMPGSRWYRGWAAEASAYWALGVDASEQLNLAWGARALRAGLRACKGDLVRAYGWYRKGVCIDGPKGQATARLARWVRWRLARGGVS